MFTFSRKPTHDCPYPKMGDNWIDVDNKVKLLTILTLASGFDFLFYKDYLQTPDDFFNFLDNECVYQKGTWFIPILMGKGSLNNEQFLVEDPEDVDILNNLYKELKI